MKLDFWVTLFFINEYVEQTESVFIDDGLICV